MKVHTFRGRLAPSEQRRIIVDDGRFTHGMRITKFQTFPVITSGAQLSSATLATQFDSLPNMDAEDNRQIAWSVTAYDVVTVTTQSVIDPNHVVVQDLYVRNNTPGEEVNYLIIAEAITLSEDQAILALIKERSQDDLR